MVFPEVGPIQGGPSRPSPGAVPLRGFPGNVPLEGVP
jgi:hypothetical protein